MLLWIRWSKKQQCPQTSRFHNWSWKRAQHLDSNCYWPDYRSWTRSNHQTPNQAKRRFVCLLQATPLDQAVAPSEAWKNALPQRMHREANKEKQRQLSYIMQKKWTEITYCDATEEENDENDIRKECSDINDFAGWSDALNHTNVDEKPGDPKSHEDGVVESNRIVYAERWLQCGSIPVILCRRWSNTFRFNVIGEIFVESRWTFCPGKWWFETM